MPPVRHLDYSDGIRILTSFGVEFNEPKVNIKGRLAGVAGNLKKKETKFNEWLQLQEPFAKTYLRADYEQDHPVWTNPDNLPPWRIIDGDNVIEIIMWIQVHLYSDAPLEFNVRIQNKELGPITGEWW